MIIPRLKEILHHVEDEVADFQYFHWNTEKEPPKYDALVLTEGKLRFDEIAGGSVYNTVLRVEGLVLSLPTTADDVLESLHDRTLKSLGTVSGYHAISIRNIDVYNTLISDREVVAMFFVLEYERREAYA